jgi:hypothetical protein
MGTPSRSHAQSELTVTRMFEPEMSASSHHSPIGQAKFVEASSVLLLSRSQGQASAYLNSFFATQLLSHFQHRLKS